MLFRSVDGENRRLWTQKPDFFISNTGELLADKVRAFAAGRIQDPDAVDISDL